MTKKFQERRATRMRKRRQQRFISMIMIVTGAALIVALFLILPGFLPADIDKVPLGDYPVDLTAPLGNALGDPNAPLTIIEFSDFQCGACAGFESEVLPQLIEAYVKTGKVYFIYRSVGSFLHSGSLAEDKIEAAYCAGDQGQFFTFNQMIFANRGNTINDKALETIASYIGLDAGTFNQCLSSNKYADQLEQDYADTQQFGIQGTPSFVINGVLWETGGYVPDFEEFAAEIENRLAVLGGSE